MGWATQGAAGKGKKRKGAGGKAVQAAAVTLVPFPSMQPAAVESLRYRAEDVARTVGRAAVKDARVCLLPFPALNQMIWVYAVGTALKGSNLKPTPSKVSLPSEDHLTRPSKRSCHPSGPASQR
jgi:hypothetical protein